MTLKLYNWTTLPVPIGVLGWRWNNVNGYYDEDQNDFDDDDVQGWIWNLIYLINSYLHTWTNFLVPIHIPNRTSWHDDIENDDDEDDHKDKNMMVMVRINMFMILRIYHVDVKL